MKTMISSRAFCFSMIVDRVPSIGFRRLACLLLLQSFMVCQLFSASPPQRPRSGNPAPKKTQALFIQAGTVYPGTNHPIKNGAVIIEGTTIKAVGGPELEPPEGAKILRFPGKHLMPGFIDAASRLLTLPGDFSRAGGTDPGLLSSDGLDPFNEAWKEAVKQGITSTYVAFGPIGTMPGRGAIIRLNGSVFTKDLCLKAKAQLESAIWPDSSSFAGRSPQSSVSFYAGEDQQGGRGKTGSSHVPPKYKHREPGIDYDKPVPVTDKEERESLDTPLDGPEKDRVTGLPKSETPAERIIFSGRSSRYFSSSAETTFDLINGYSALRSNLLAAKQHQRRLMWHQQDLGAWERACAKIKQEIAEAKQKGQNLSKPMPPKPNPPSENPLGEALLPVLEGKEKLRVWADSMVEIRLVMKLAGEFKIQATIVGGLEAHRMARELADNDVSVILIPLAATASLRADLNVSRQSAAALFAADVQLGFGTGVAGRTGSHLLRHFVAQAVSHGLDPAYALRAVTLTNAELLGVSDRIGSLSPGKEAHITILDGPPFSTKSTAVMTLVGSKVVYQKDEKKDPKNGK